MWIIWKPWNLSFRTNYSTEVGRESSLGEEIAQLVCFLTSSQISLNLLLERKAMTNLDSILKSRDITLLTKVHLVKVRVFPGVMYGCESWTIKKADCWRIDAFVLWCSRRVLRVPWTAGRSNQSILKKSVLNIHWKDWCWGWNSNTLAIWCEELTHWKRC